MRLRPALSATVAAGALVATAALVPSPAVAEDFSKPFHGFAPQEGLDTVEANLALGFKDDERDYAAAAAMLRTLGVRSIEVIANNPDKVEKLRELIAMGGKAFEGKPFKPC